MHALAATPADWRSRIIYQVLTDRYARTDGSTTAPCVTANNVYCGGTWRGITNHLDYIQDMGFTAIWISPITLQVSGPDTYHGYSQSSLYSVNPSFGSSADLLALSTALHARGMYLMVDIVVNHFGSTTPESGNWATYNPFNNAGYFHPYCEITLDDYNDRVQEAIEDCWVTDQLADVNTTQTSVIDMYESWIGELAANYSIDGFRIDTVKHVQSSFWPGFNAAAGVYCVGEVLDSDPSYVCPYTDVMDGILNYPLYFQLITAFESSSNDMGTLADMINTLKSSCADTTLMAPFLENHDNPRFPYYTSDSALIRNAMLTTLMADGPPIIYEGQEWGLASSNDPANREAIWLQSGAYSDSGTTGAYHGLIALANQVRNQLLSQSGNQWALYQNWVIYNDAHTMALRKGYDGAQSVTVVTNQGSSGSAYTLTLSGADSGWDTGASLVEALSCATGTTDSSSADFTVTVQSAPQIWLAGSLLDGTGLCGH